MRPFDPERGFGLDHFRRVYRPLIRPPGHLAALREAFAVDDEFVAEFRLLRPYLREAQQDWPRRIVQHLMLYHAIRANFGDRDLETLRRAYKRHGAYFAAGRFDEPYLASLEELALLFLYHDVRSVWLGGAYGRLEEELVDHLFEATRRRPDVPLRRLMRAFSKGMVIELGQIQRVFTMYERAVAERALAASGTLAAE